MAKVVWRYLCLFVLCVCILITPIDVCATCPSPISDLYTDEATGWNIINGGHMGYRYTRFLFEDVEELEEYHDDIRAGIALWGNYISCTEDRNGEGEFRLRNWPLRDIYAEAVPIPMLNSDDHVLYWTITINDYLFYQACQQQQGAIVIAHELGHVFGLAHVGGQHRLMYEALTGIQTVTADDKSGMVVMTHAHVHNSATTYTLEQHSVAQHKKRCGVCCAFYLINCTYSSHYHSGNYHYFQMNCSCGNTGLKQISCSPLNCPYTGGQIMQA